MERWPIEAIHPYPRNARLHSDEQIDLIAASIEKYGFTAPLLVDEEGVLIYGHGRHRAALKLGIADLPVCVAVGWSEEDKAAYRIADNQIALRSTWDMPLLQAELKDLSITDYDMPLLGFTERDLNGFDIQFGTEGNVDPEAAPEPVADPISKRGDLWLLGDHRLLCGDCLSADDVARLMNGEKAGLMNTDPPYGVDYGGIRDSIRASGRGGKKYKDIENDELDGAALQDFLEASIRTALPHLIDNPAFYLWHPMLTQGTFFAAAAAAADILIHRQIIWVKPSLILGRGDYHWRHELCFYGWIQGKRCAWLMGREQTTVWEVGRENDAIHPTQKPTELFRRPIQNHLHPGEIAYEPFSGSGSQIIAAEMTGRKCYALEIEPSYVDVAIQRWQNFTGKQATLEVTGEAYGTKKAPAAGQRGPRVRVSTS